MLAKIGNNYSIRYSEMNKILVNDGATFFRMYSLLNLCPSKMGATSSNKDKMK
jgi:hypothetical protein